MSFQQKYDQHYPIELKKLEEGQRTGNQQMIAEATNWIQGNDANFNREFNKPADWKPDPRGALGSSQEGSGATTMYKGKPYFVPPKLTDAELTANQENRTTDDYGRPKQEGDILRQVPDGGFAFLPKIALEVNADGTYKTQGHQDKDWRMREPAEFDPATGQYKPESLGDEGIGVEIGKRQRSSFGESLLNNPYLNPIGVGTEAVTGKLGIGGKDGLSPLDQLKIGAALGTAAYATGFDPATMGAGGTTGTAGVSTVGAPIAETGLLADGTIAGTTTLAPAVTPAITGTQALTTAATANSLLDGDAPPIDDFGGGPSMPPIDDFGGGPPAPDGWTPGSTDGWDWGDPSTWTGANGLPFDPSNDGWNLPFDPSGDGWNLPSNPGDLIAGGLLIDSLANPPDAPVAPDFMGAAQDQAAYNNPNQVNPYGSQTRTQNPDGTWTVTEALNPAQQALLDAQTGRQTQAGGLSTQAMNNYSPVGSYEGARDDVYDAMMTRYNTDADRRESAKRAELIAAGHNPNDAATGVEMDTLNRGRNDAMTQAMINASTIAQGDYRSDILGHNTNVGDISTFNTMASPNIPTYDQGTGADFVNPAIAAGNFDTSVYNTDVVGSNTQTAALADLLGTNNPNPNNSYTN